LNHFPKNLVHIVISYAERDELHITEYMYAYHSLYDNFSVHFADTRAHQLQEELNFELEYWNQEYQVNLSEKQDILVGNLTLLRGFDVTKNFNVVCFLIFEEYLLFQS
jgi:hypothetical protein